MPRFVVILLLLLIVIAGALFFLSRQAEEVPTQTIEIEMNTPADAS